MEGQQSPHRSQPVSRRAGSPGKGRDIAPNLHGPVFAVSVRTPAVVNGQGPPTTGNKYQTESNAKEHIGTEDL